MPDLSFKEILPEILSALLGGSVVIWLTKLMLERLIKQYDERHERHEEKLESFADKMFEALSAIHAKLAAIEVRAAEIAVMRVDVKAIEKDMATLHAGYGKLKNDVDEAHHRIRAIRGA